MCVCVGPRKNGDERTTILWLLITFGRHRKQTKPKKIGKAQLCRRTRVGHLVQLRTITAKSIDSTPSPMFDGLGLLLGTSQVPFSTIQWKINHWKPSLSLPWWFRILLRHWCEAVTHWADEVAVTDPKRVDSHNNNNNNKCTCVYVQLMPELTRVKGSKWSQYYNNNKRKLNHNWVG